MTPLRDLNEDRELRPASILLGHIRLGVMAKGRDNKLRPTQSSTFVFTSSDPNRLAPLAQDYGGKVEKYTPQGAGAEPWRLVTESDVIRALFPFPTRDENVTQDWELWTAAGLKRRCDGRTCVLIDVDEETGERTEVSDVCVCRDTGKPECSPNSRLQLFFPATGFGLWQLQTGSKIAAIHLYDQMGLIESVAGGMLNRIPVALTYAPKKLSYFDPKDRKRHSTTKRVVSVSIASDVGQTYQLLGIEQPQQALIAAIETALASTGRSLGAGSDEGPRALGAGSADKPAGQQYAPSQPPSKRPAQPAPSSGPAGGASGKASVGDASASADPGPEDSSGEGAYAAGEGAETSSPGSPWEAYESALREASFRLGEDRAAKVVGEFWRAKKWGPVKRDWPEERLSELAQHLEDAAQQTTLGVES